VRFGAGGGNFSTANGFASIAGALDRFDYNVFGDQFNTQGSGINDNYSNSLQGMNVGAKLSDRATLRLRARHANSRTGVQGEWKFNGQPLLPPDADARARQNNLMVSADGVRSLGPLATSRHRFRVQPSNTERRHARRPRLRCECVRFHGLLFSRCGAHQPCRA
jgi:hypothetical protein